MDAVELERERIRLLVERDGREKALAWVRRTRDLYATALRSPASHASNEVYRWRFEASVGAFNAWLAEQGQQRKRDGGGDEDG